MILAKIKSAVLSKALEDRNNFWTLSVYLEEYRRTEDDCFITEVVKEYGATEKEPWTTNLRLSLSDYLFNEMGQEADKLWELAERLTGKKSIDYKCVKIIEL